jgi:hypothetical protein
MSSQRESWLKIKKGNIILHSENDSYAFMRNGAETEEQIVMSVKEAREKGLHENLIKKFEEIKPEELNEVE